MQKTKLLELAITIVIILVIALLAVNIKSFLPSLNKLTNTSLVFTFDDFPCLYACYTNLAGTEVNLLSNNFDEVRGFNIMIDYFPCNYELMKIATMAYELSRWIVTRSDGELTASQATLVDTYDEVKKNLYYCFTGTCDDVATANYFCKLDTYLTSFDFFPCDKYYTLNDFINPMRSLYANRNGTDINNNFICAKGGPYDLCAKGPEGGYGNDCRPAWVTLKGFEGGSYSYGRCEDFAILYYSLFRAVGVPVTELRLNISYCDLPCPCKKLISSCSSLKYAEINCAVPANISIFGVGNSSVGGWGVVQGCDPGLLFNYRRINWDQGLFQITSQKKPLSGPVNYQWFVNQSKYGVNNASFTRNLVFDNNPGNDFNMTEFSFNDSTGSYPSFTNTAAGDPCAFYPITDPKVLAQQCDLYVIYSEQEDVNSKTKTPISLYDFVNSGKCS